MAGHRLGHGGAYGPHRVRRRGRDDQFGPPHRARDLLVRNQSGVEWSLRQVQLVDVVAIDRLGDRRLASPDPHLVPSVGQQVRQGRSPASGAEGRGSHGAAWGPTRASRPSSSRRMLARWVKTMNVARSTPATRTYGSPGWRSHTASGNAAAPDMEASETYPGAQTSVTQTTAITASGRGGGPPAAHG